ncbi:hypothetical protein ACQ4LE_002522 [Meloidogyne hapla]|uniref:Secreted protein n=1 Tax=Meloidogyne hapla TaxID=6305 RepID=A0A1I8BJC9_MELHA
MESIQFLIQAFALLVLTNLFYSDGANRPEYLSIDGFQNCTGNKKIDTYKVYCLPAVQHQSCANSAWEELHKLNGTEALQPCEGYETTTVKINGDNGNDDNGDGDDGDDDC